MLLAAAGYSNQTLKLWCAFGLCVVNCCLYCLFAQEKEEEEGEEKVAKKVYTSDKCKTAVHNLSQHYLG